MERRGDAETRGHGDEENKGDTETQDAPDTETILNSQTTKDKQQRTKDKGQTTIPNQPLTIRECPTSWDELQVWCRRAIATERKLAIAYPPPTQLAPSQIWEQLVGIAKFLSRTSQSATLTQLKEKLELSDRTLQLGLDALSLLGFQVKRIDWGVQIHRNPGESDADAIASITNEPIQEFLAGVEEELFRRQYFYQVPLATIQIMAAQTALMG